MIAEQHLERYIAVQKYLESKPCKNIPLYCLLLLFQFMYPAAVQADSQSLLSELATPCLACHSVLPGDATHIGPSLSGVAGREMGADLNYTYSTAFTAKAMEGGVWDRNTMDRFLKNPQALIEGIAMNYPGVPDDDKRKVLLDWLFSDPAANLAVVESANYLNDSEVRKILDNPVDIAYGEYLAGECLTCHQVDTHDSRIPPIHKLTQDYFIYALLEYRNGARSNPVMQTVAGALGADEIATLSVFFAEQ